MDHRRTTIRISVLLSVLLAVTAWSLWPGEYWEPVWTRDNCWPVCTFDDGRQLVVNTWDASQKSTWELHAVDPKTGETLAVIETRSAAFHGVPLPDGRLLYVTVEDMGHPVRVCVWDGEQTTDVLVLAMSAEERLEIARLIDPSTAATTLRINPGHVSTDDGQASVEIQFRLQGRPVTEFVARTYLIDAETLEVKTAPDTVIANDARYKTEVLDARIGRGPIGASRVVEDFGVPVPLETLYELETAQAVANGNTLTLTKWWQPSDRPQGWKVMASPPTCSVDVWRRDRDGEIRQTLSKESGQLFADKQPNQTVLSLDGSRMFIGLQTSSTMQRSTACYAVD